MVLFLFHFGFVEFSKLRKERRGVECSEKAELVPNGSRANLTLIDIGIAYLPGYLCYFLVLLVWNDELNRMVLVEDASNLMELWVVVQFLHIKMIGLCV